MTRLPVDHTEAAEQLLRGLHDLALPPSLFIEIAKAHALLAIANLLDRLHDRTVQPDNLPRGTTP